MSAYRKYRVVKKIRETDHIASFYLQPVDGLPPADFRPGQHLLFKLDIPGRDLPVLRNYSFSSAYNSSFYRVSVKKEAPPRTAPQLAPGIASSYLYDQVKEGDILEAKGPLGNFCVGEENNEIPVFIAGGIGITPLLSMAEAVLKTDPRRRIHFLYGVNNRREHAFGEELRALRQLSATSRFLTFYALPEESDQQGHHYDRAGFISIDAIGDDLLHADTRFYLCGPAPMMAFITEALQQRGIENSRILTENFTTASVEETDEEPVATGSSAFTVEFRRSGKTLSWDDRFPSLLEFAEYNDIDISSGCLFGDCGTCLTKLQGEVQYKHPTMVKPGKGECLPCSCVPASDISLDA